MLAKACLWYLSFLLFASISLSSIMFIFCSFFLGFLLQSGLIETSILLIEITTQRSRVKMTAFLMSFLSFGFILESTMYYAEIH